MAEYEYIKSGLGGEVTDQTLRNVGPRKPVWQLAPLPLSQLHEPQEHRGPVRSLHSYCLSSVSRNLHLFHPDSFTGVNILHIRRIISRILQDREYDLDPCIPSDNPDEATIWALSAILDSENAQSFTLALPTLNVLDHLPPNPSQRHVEHPLIALPRLYSSPSPQSLLFITTLTLDGMNDIINDHNVLSLKWCTNLTALWMKGCKVTDAAIRLLASSLELPGTATQEQVQETQTGKGMWRLRAWFLPGCKGITDRSMKSFARWPGLTLLDLRETSCTTSAIDVFNRFSQSLFAGYNADFQPCTDGLVQLFSFTDSPAEVMENLTLTLTKAAGSLKPISLHLIPSSEPVPSFYLPDPPSVNSANEPRKPSSSASSSAFRSGGIGQIYGSGVSRIADEVRDHRDRLSTAMRMKYEEEWLENATPAQKRKRTMAENKANKARYNHTYIGSQGYMVGKVYKEKKLATASAGANDRSKKFVKGTTKSQPKGKAEAAEESLGKGDRKAMLVRMVSDHWEKLQWALPGATNTLLGSSTILRTNAQSTSTNTAESILNWSSSQSHSRKSRPTDLVDDILGITGKDHSSRSQFTFSLTPARVRLQPSSSPSSRSLPSSNPFRISSIPKANGVRPLNSKADPISSQSISGFSHNQLAGTKSASTGKCPIGTNANPDLDFVTGFSSTGNRKRAFDGASNAPSSQAHRVKGESHIMGEPSRRGMKLFTTRTGSDAPTGR